MSEDVDFKVVLRGAAPSSANQLRKELGRLRDRMTAGLQAAGFDIDPANTAQVRSRDANRYTVYHLTAGPTDTQPAPLRAALLIELNHTQLRLPTVRLPVASFITEAFEWPSNIDSRAPPGRRHNVVRPPRGDESSGQATLTQETLTTAPQAEMPRS